MLHKNILFGIFIGNIFTTLAKSSYKSYTLKLQKTINLYYHHHRKHFILAPSFRKDVSNAITLLLL